LKKAQATSNVVVKADPATCSFQGSPIAREIDFTSSCDQAKRVLAQNFIPYKNEAAPAGTVASITIGTSTIPSLNATLNDKRNGFSADSAKGIGEFKKAVLDAAKANGLTAKADDKTMNKGMVLAILVYLVILVTMVYGPIAAMLVELFPTRIRYTSMSLPYHIGNGWFGGLLPTTAFAMVAATGDIYYGLWYPVIVAAGTFIIGMIFVKETKDVDIYAND
jgi:Sugar (and other) transporter